MPMERDEPEFMRFGFCRRQRESRLQRMGHASVSFTLDVYGHILPGQQADAAAAAAALVDLP